MRLIQRPASGAAGDIDEKDETNGKPAQMATQMRAPLFRLTLILLALTAFAAHPTAAQEGIVPSTPALDSHLAEASRSNPSLAGTREQHIAARERISQAGAWMDPKLGLGVMNMPADNPLKLNREPMTGIWTNVGQSIPLTGKYRSRRNAASAIADATGARVALRANAVANTVRSAWFDWAYLRAATATVDTTIRLVDELLVITRTKYETGRGLQQDLLRLQTERSRLESRRVELLQKARNAGRRFAIELGRDPQDAPAPPDSLPVMFSALDETVLFQQLQRTPSVEMARHALRASAARVTLAQQMWWPELMVGAGYGVRRDADNGMGRPDFITVTAGVTLPIFGGAKQGAAVEEAVAEKRSAQRQLRSAELDAGNRLASLLDEDRRQADQIQLYDEGVLPQARAALASATSAYSVGKVDVEALIAAERELIDSRLERLAHLRDRAKVRARVAELVEQPEVDVQPSANERTEEE